VPLAIIEQRTAVVSALYQADTDMAIWWVTPTECIAALMRRQREGTAAVGEVQAIQVDLERLLSSALEMEPVQQVRLTAQRLQANHPLRAADALQLAAALVWAEQQPSGREFVSLDRRLRDAAQREGLTVLPHRL